MAISSSIIFWSTKRIRSRFVTLACRLKGKTRKKSMEPKGLYYTLLLNVFCPMMRKLMYGPLVSCYFIWWLALFLFILPRIRNWLKYLHKKGWESFSSRTRFSPNSRTSWRKYLSLIRLRDTQLLMYWVIPLLLDKNSPWSSLQSLRNSNRYKGWEVTRLLQLSPWENLILSRWL